MRQIRKLIITLFIVLLFVGMFSVAFNVYRNITLNNSFKLRENAYPYEQAVVNLNIDLEEISKLFPNASAPIGHNYIKKITSPVDRKSVV